MASPSSGSRGELYHKLPERHRKIFEDLADTVRDTTGIATALLRDTEAALQSTVKDLPWSYENLESRETGLGSTCWVRYLAWNGKRLVVGEGLDDDPEGHSIKPVLECSTSIRILAASKLESLLTTIKNDFSETAKDIQRIVGGNDEKA